MREQRTALLHFDDPDDNELPEERFCVGLATYPSSKTLFRIEPQFPFQAEGRGFVLEGDCFLLACSHSASASQRLSLVCTRHTLAVARQKSFFSADIIKIRDYSAAPLPPEQVEEQDEDVQKVQFETSTEDGLAQLEQKFVWLANIEN